MADFLLAAPVNSDAQAPDQMAEHALERSGATPNALKRPGEDSKCMPRLAATHASDVVMPCLCAGDKVTHPQKSGDQKKNTHRTCMKIRLQAHLCPPLQYRQTQ
jgi:hypothetical protein